MTEILGSPPQLTDILRKLVRPRGHSVNKPVLQNSTESFHSDEFAIAFEKAKEALALVGKFQTPPTPDVFQIWYRFVEGKNEALNERLSFAINDLQTVDKKIIDQLHAQFFRPEEAVAVRDEVSNGLSQELVGLQKLIQSQVASGSAFNSSVTSANESLNRADASTDEVRDCIRQVLASNADMQGELTAMQQQLRASQEQVDKMRGSLLQSQRRLMTDPLTGVGNRRFFETMIAQAIDRNSKSKSEASDALSCCEVDGSGLNIFLLLIDLDKFKVINDTFGHERGDTVLKFVVKVLQQLTPRESIARFGGDEFAIFHCSEQLDSGGDLAEAISQAVAKSELSFTRSGERLGKLTTSIGVARLRPQDDRDTWFERADKLLYSAKNAGRNCVMTERLLTSQPSN